MGDFAIKRKKTRKVSVGPLHIGGDAPILIQSMTNTDTRDVSGTIEQIKRLEEAGCDIVRLAVLDMEAAEAIGEIKKSVKIPLVADIHFDYRLALKCMEMGVDKIRINPGNIGGMDRVRKVALMAKERNIPIRIGVNSGSVESGIQKKYGGVTAEGMVESALYHASLLEDCNFSDIVISIKASNVPLTLASYRMMSEKADYPLHLGVTEAGTVYRGTIKSSVGIGALLAEGIGDTIRVSLTGDPVEEVKAGIEILKSLELKKAGIEFISCPTCGRCRVNLEEIANGIEEKLQDVDANLKVAIMGCAVNGPGEAKHADIGIAGGDGEVLLFKKGQIIRKIPQEKVVDEFVDEVRKMIL
mgnify:FL=1